MILMKTWSFRLRDTLGGSVQVKGGSFDGITVKGEGAANVEPSKIVSVTGGTFQETDSGSQSTSNGTYLDIETLLPADGEVELKPDGSVGAPEPEGNPTPSPLPSWTWRKAPGIMARWSTCMGRN